MNLIIRQAKIEDAPTIGQAEREIAQEPGFFCSQPFELSDENIADTIKNETAIYLVAEVEGQLVGHAFLEPYSLQSLQHIADLNIAVHLGWQNKGIGTKLLEQILEHAKKSPTIEKIQLNVRATNVAAISLYKKFGFQEEGRLKKRVKVKNHYIDDIVMGLELKEAANHLSPMNYDLLLIKSYKYWDVYLHENQCYLGRVFVLLKEDKGVEDFLAIEGKIREEFFLVGNDVKKALKSLFKPDKMNYAALSNVSEKIHVHIVPRYKEPREFAGITFTDTRWGKNYAPYDRTFVLQEEVLFKIRDTLKETL